MSTFSSYDLKREIRFFEMMLETLAIQEQTEDVQKEIKQIETFIEDLEKELMYAQDADRYWGDQE